jgi:SAM-dependent methyltransferase
MAQNALLHLPGTKGLQRRISTTGAMNEPRVMSGWADDVVEACKLGNVDVVGATMAEVGPGHSLGVAVALLLAGAARVHAVDVKRFADPTNPEPFKPIAEYCQANGKIHGQTPDLRELLKRLEYSIVDDSGNWPIPAGSLDVVYSYFSGEHLRVPADVLNETLRVLRPGGLCIHAIDLRDHLNMDSNWLNFLYYEPWMYEAMTSKRGQWCNRFRSPQWREIFADKFEIILFREGTEPIPSHFRMDKLASQFKKYDEKTLAVSKIWVVAKKRDSK